MIRGFNQLRKMASSLIPQVKDVDIDSTGVFKYILIKVTCPDTDGKLQDKLIVRGYAECPYHSCVEVNPHTSSRQIEDEIGGPGIIIYTQVTGTTFV